MAENVTDSYYIIEVAPNLFLSWYSQGGAYCASRDLYRVIKDGDIPALKRNVTRFDSLDDIGKYIKKRGSKEDFLGWCEDMKEKYGGDGKPKIRKVTVTVTVEFEEPMEMKI